MAYTEEQLKEAARKALAAGDTAAAKRLVDAAKEAGAKTRETTGPIKSLTDQAISAFNAGDDATGNALLAEASRLSVSSGMAPEGYVVNPEGRMEDLRSPANPNIPTGTAVSFGVGAGQGLGFGGLDETVAGMHAMTGGDYEYEAARMREVERRAQENNPIAYYAGLIPGAVASSVSAGKALGVNPQGANLLGTMARGAGIGLGEGATFGFLSGEGGVLPRIAGAVKGGLLGAGVGAAAPAVTAGATKALRGLLDVTAGNVQSALGVARQGKADRMLAETVRRSGRSADDIADDVARAAQDGQTDFRMMDAMGKAGQRRVSGIVRAGDDGAEELAQFLERRQLGQPERIGAFVDDAFGMGGKTAQETADGLRSARGAAADAAYSAARGNAAPVDIRGALQVIDDRIGGMKGSGVAGDGIDGKLATFRNRLAAPDPAAPNIAVELSDFDRVLGVKQDVQDAIGAAVRAGRNNEARELGKLVSELDAALEAASDGYRAANDGFREASRVIAAVDDGAAMGRPTRRAADTTRQFARMTPEQQAAARAGYGDRLLARLESNTAPTANRAKAMQSPKVAAEIDVMATDPRLLADRLMRESQMWETMNRALGGSRTADNLADQNSMGILADVARVGRDLVTNTGNGILTLATRAGNAAGGVNDATRKIVADALMSDNPRAALARAMARQTSSEAKQRLADAIVRAVGRDYLPTP